MNKNRIIEDYLQGKHPIEQESWEMPSADELERDEALFESLMAKKKAPKRIRIWPLAVAACVAGFVAIFLAPPRKMQPQIALERKTVNCQLSTVNSPNRQYEEEVITEESFAAHQQEIKESGERLIAYIQQEMTEDDF